VSATSVLAGLVSGLALGIAASLSSSAALLWLVAAIQPVGTVFLRSIQMTVVPLVMASLIVGIAGGSHSSGLARLGGRALALFVMLVSLAAGLTALVAAPLLGRLVVDPSTVEAFVGDATVVGNNETSVPGLSEWIVSLVPANPIAAAAEGSMLPLIVFTLALGAVLTRLPPESSTPVLAFFRGIADAMMELVRWVLRLAPIGVFALAAPLAARLGLAAAGAVVYYMAVSAALMTLFTLALLYPAAIVGGRLTLRRFARAAAPAQAVAFSSRSTMATLPAMIDAARRLDLAPAVIGFLVPLAASIFRFGSAVGQTVGVLFAAQLYGATPSLPQLVTIVVTVVVTTFAVPGIPGGSILVMVPILLAADLPVEGIALLLGADTIPDMFRTTANVTGGISVAAILGRQVGPDTPPNHNSDLSYVPGKAQ
jgi:proton glutamate symport protein